MGMRFYVYVGPYVVCRKELSDEWLSDESFYHLIDGDGEEIIIGMNFKFLDRRKTFSEYDNDNAKIYEIKSIEDEIDRLIFNHQDKLDKLRESFEEIEIKWGVVPYVC